jgi:hypothetical protein
MNHPFVIAQSKLCAARLIAETHASETDRLSRAYRLILGRPPSLAEQQAALKYIEGLPMESANAAISGWTQVVQTLFATIDFRYLQ